MYICIITVIAHCYHFTVSPTVCEVHSNLAFKKTASAFSNFFVTFMLYKVKSLYLKLVKRWTMICIKNDSCGIAYIYIWIFGM